jgi:hypothetical protein
MLFRIASLKPSIFYEYIARAPKFSFHAHLSRLVPKPFLLVVAAFSFTLHTHMITINFSLRHDSSLHTLV